MLCCVLAPGIHTIAPNKLWHRRHARAFSGNLPSSSPHPRPDLALGPWPVYTLPRCLDMNPNSTDKRYVGRGADLHPLCLLVAAAKNTTGARHLCWHCAGLVLWLGAGAGIHRGMAWRMFRGLYLGRAARRHAAEDKNDRQVCPSGREQRNKPPMYSRRRWWWWWWWWLLL